MFQKAASTFLLAALLASSVPGAANAQSVLSGFTGASADSIAGSILSRAVPGGQALTSGNTGLRQPNAAELRQRAEVAVDLPAIERGTQTAQPVKSQQQINTIRGRLQHLVVQMRRQGATRALMAEYATTISALYVYERDLSIQQRMQQLEAKQPIKLYPGEELAFSYQGSCADHNLPAPSSAEAVSLVPLDTLFPKELQGVAADVSRYGASHSQYPTQAIIWFMRSLGGDADLNNYQYVASQIDLARPGDWNTVANWQEDQARRATRKQLFGQLASLFLTQTGIGSQVNSVLGTAQSFMSEVQGSTPGQIATTVNSQLVALRSEPIQGARPNDLSGLSRLNGMDVVAEANSLKVDALIYNEKPYPVTFDPNWVLVAQAERPTQRSIGPPGGFHFPGYVPVNPALAGNVRSAIRDGLHGLKDSPAGSAIESMVTASGDACSMFGIGDATSDFASYPTPGSALSFANAAAGILNVFKVAFTGSQLDGTAAPPVQQFLDIVLVAGGVAAAIAAAPEIAALAGIGAEMSAGEALAAALEEGAFDFFTDGSAAEEASYTANSCSYVSQAAGLQAVVNWAGGEPPNATDWLNIADVLRGIFSGSAPLNVRRNTSQPQASPSPSPAA